MKKQSTLTAMTFALAIASSTVSLAPSALAHGNEQHKKEANAPISTDEHAFGRQGNPKKVSRTINIDMNDNMRFSPSTITVKEGETVRFVVHNKGRAMHELVLGTLDELKAHGEMMKQHPGMEHDEPYMAHVAPGKKEELVWQFTKAGNFHYGCLVAGHFESGMIGKLTVKKG